MRRIFLIFSLMTGIAAASQPFIQTTYEFEGISIVRRHFAELQSTQNTISEHLKDVSAQQWVTISASTQKGGIGMWGRSWVSPPGNVFVTFAVPVADPYKNSRYVSQIAGVVVCDTLREFGLKSKLRWVNNVLTEDDEKIAGIL